MKRIRVSKVRPRRRRVFVLRWQDPDTKKTKQKSTGVESERMAEDKRRDQELKLNLPRRAKPKKSPPAEVDEVTSVTWKDFRKRYEADYLVAEGRRASTTSTWSAAAKALETIVAPELVSDVTKEALQKLIARRREDGLAEATIANNLRHILAALRWGKGEKLVQRVPKIATKKRGKRITNMRSLPITQEQFDLMLTKVEEVRKKDTEDWKQLLRLLWYSGLRISEAVALSWDPAAEFSIDLSGTHPRWRILGSAQKSGNDEFAPMTPDCAEFLLAIPAKKRVGRVFFGGRYSTTWVKRIVGQVGFKASIIVDRKGEKFAGAHTLRRSFGTRWAPKVMPAVLQRLMRHSDIHTTMTFYVGIATDQISASLWDSLNSGADVAQSRTLDFSGGAK